MRSPVDTYALNNAFGKTITVRARADKTGLGGLTETTAFASNTIESGKATTNTRIEWSGNLEIGTWDGTKIVDPNDPGDDIGDNIDNIRFLADSGGSSNYAYGSMPVQGGQVAIESGWIVRLLSFEAYYEIAGT